MINLNNFVIEHKPYPFIVFNEAIDEELYSQLCKEFNSEKNFFTKEEVLDKISNNKKMEKFTLSSVNDKKNYSDYCSSRNNLKKFTQYICSNSFQSELKNIFLQNNINVGYNFDNYSNNLKNKIKNFLKIQGQTFYNIIELSSIPFKGGYINPHTDGMNKIFSLIIPIVNNDEYKSAENYSTDILEHLDGKDSFNRVNKMISKDKVKTVKKIEFKKRQILCLIKTHNSLHSVGPINYDGFKEVYRNSINFFKCKSII